MTAEVQDEAVASLVEILAHTSGDRPFLRGVLAYLCGQRFHRIHDDESALKYLNLALDSVPDLRPALRLQFKIHAELGDYNRAIEKLDHEIRATQHPREAAAIYRMRGRLAERHFDDLQAAIACYEAALQSTSQDLIVLRSLEHAFAALGDLERTTLNLEHQSDILQDTRASASLLYELARLEGHSGGDLQLACACLETALEYQPKHSFLLQDLALMAQADGRVETMIFAAQQAQEFLPPTSDSQFHSLAWYRIFQTLIQKESDSSEVAFSALRHSAELDSTNYTLWRTLSDHALAKQAHLFATEALMQQIKLLDKKETKPRAHLWYRLAGVEQSQRPGSDLATRLLNKALQLDPGHLGALQDLSRIYHRNKNASGLHELSRHLLRQSAALKLSPSRTPQSSFFELDNYSKKTETTVTLH